jgi:MFS family permease
MSLTKFLDRESSIASPDFNRWLIPPAALSIHLAIGQAYAFSVFNLPMSKLIGISASTPDDWKLTTLGWIFSFAIVMLGLSAAFGGKWVDRAGPRKAMLGSALCFSTGFLISALGTYLHNIWIVYLGYGFIGGIGLGLGYISPVKMLISWFPDRPGMATGMAIMGFGGGAMIGAPLAVGLMDYFKTAATMGVTKTFFAMGLIYFVFMMWGVFTARIPAPGWKPAGYVPPAAKPMITKYNVSADNAIKTPQFYFLWVVLCLNVTAGIGVLGQASAMSQEMFKGKITPAAAAGFVGLLSLFNMGGRFFWSSSSDYIGRQRTYMIYFALGACLYALTPTSGSMGSVGMFVALYAIILTMYGGGFATVPAYLADMFGKAQVSAIHGRLLTAWSMAGILGPVLVNYIREYQISHGVAAADSYSTTMYLMAGLLVVGFISNWMVKPVESKFHSPELN